MKRYFASSSLVVLHYHRPHFLKLLIRETCSCITTLASFVRTESLATRPLEADKKCLRSVNMDLMSVPSCCTGLFFFHQLCRSDKSYKVLLWISDSLLWYVHTWSWGDCAWVRFLLGAGVNTPSFQLPTPAFGYRCGTRVYWRITLYLGTKESTGHLYSHRFPTPIHCFGSQ